MFLRDHIALEGSQRAVLVFQALACIEVSRELPHHVKLNYLGKVLLFK